MLRSGAAPGITNTATEGDAKRNAAFHGGLRRAGDLQDDVLGGDVGVVEDTVVPMEVAPEEQSAEAGANGNTS
eukprot:11147446-Lingulodinium_polyedra.AAC.1